MNKITIVTAVVLFLFSAGSMAQGGDLRIVLIRHGEKPLKGDGLTCKGQNRSQELVPLLYSRFKVPSVIYVPNKGRGDTKRSRMYLTILPFVQKYGGMMNTDYHEDELKALAKDIRHRSGVVLVVWEHGGIPEIARRLGVQEEGLRWKDGDYDSMWIVRYEHGQAVLTKDSEGLKPGKNCP